MIVADCGSMRPQESNARVTAKWRVERWTAPFHELLFNDKAGAIT
jgi:hypothetical protein